MAAMPLKKPHQNAMPLQRAALSTFGLSGVMLLCATAGAQTTALDATPPTLPITLQYESAFRSYQPYVDPQVQSWRESNERVGQIGGWRAYAKEAAVAQPANADPATDAHSGHHGGAKR